MGKGGSTIGYHYLATLLFGIGRGPVNELTHIWVGGKLAWEGNACNNYAQIINKPELFGGEKKEGGIQGIFASFMGARDQVLPGVIGPFPVGTSGPYQTGTLPDLKATLATEEAPNVSEFRGRHIVWYDGLVASMNPYIKAWEFRRRRTTAGWYLDQPWYPAKATIWLKDGTICAMNPAHIIYECLTNPIWGRGLPASDLDENSFIYAANLFCAEFFGLCMQWMRRDEIGNFIQSVLDHCGAVLYTDRETGLINIKPIRDDYDPDDLPHFTLDNGLLSLAEDDSGSSDGIADEVIVEGIDPASDQAIEGRAHNLAVRHFMRGSSPNALSYPGLPTTELCNRVAERDRNLGAAGLRKFSPKMDRAGFRLHPGAVFKISYPARGISGLVLRVGEVDDGNLANGTITVRAVQDVFGLPLTAFVKPVDNTFGSSTDAKPAVAVLFEASYRDGYIRVTEADMNTLEEGDSYIVSAAARPNTSHIDYDLITRAQGETAFDYGNTAFFTPSGTLAADIDRDDTSFVLNGVTDLPDDPVGQALYVLGEQGGEYMRIVSWNENTSTVTVARGCVDTWPKVHAAGTYAWFIDDDLGYDARNYLEGETVQAKAITRTNFDELAENEADLLTAVMEGRPFRPYPPADVKVAGVSIYDYTSVTVTEGDVTWVERNRVTQADQLVGFYEATVTPEDGTTYEIDILTQDRTGVVNTYSSITSPWSYSGPDQVSDGTDSWAFIPARLYAVRDGVRSLEQDWFLLKGDRCGYGWNYGNNYGGDCS